MSRVESGRGQKVSENSRVVSGGVESSQEVLKSHGLAPREIARPVESPPAFRQPKLGCRQQRAYVTNDSRKRSTYAFQLYPPLTETLVLTQSSPVDQYGDDSLRLIHGVPQFPRSLARGELY